MAYKVTSPGRGGYQIPSSPEGTYESLASKYASDFRRALRQEEQNELNLKIMAWQNGDITWEALEEYMSSRIDGAKDGSSEKVNLLDTKSRLESQKQEMFENEQARIAADLRTQMVEEMGEGGLTDQEQLDIVQEIKGKVDENSDTYQDLVSEEAQLKTRIAEAERSAGAGAAKSEAIANYRQTKANALNKIGRIERAYQLGDITGHERDSLTKDVAETLSGAIENLQAAGGSVPASDVEQTTNLLDSSASLLKLREQGLVADAVNADGEKVTVDTTKQNFPREYQLTSDGRLVIGDAAAIGGVYRDPVRGKYKIPGSARSYDTRSEAIKAARDQGQFSFEAVLPKADGTTRTIKMAKDPTTGAFYNIEDKSEIYTTIPQTREQLETTRFTTESGEPLPKDWQTNQDFVDWMGEQMKAGENIDTTYELPEATPMDETTRDRKGLFEKIGVDFDIPEGVSDFAETATEKGVLGPAPAFATKLPEIKKVGRDVGEFAKRTAPQAKEFATRVGRGLGETSRRIGEQKFNVGPLSVSPAIGMPDIKIGDFDVPEFNVPTFKRFTPSFGGARQPQTTQPKASTVKQQPSGTKGLLGRAKSFGKNLFGSVRGLFGGK